MPLTPSLPLFIYTSYRGVLAYKESWHKGMSLFACTLSTLNTKLIINWEYNIKMGTKTQNKSASNRFRTTLYLTIIKSC